jgi:hypothetical protein
MSVPWNGQLDSEFDLAYIVMSGQDFQWDKKVIRPFEKGTGEYHSNIPEKVVC